MNKRKAFTVFLIVGLVFFIAIVFTGQQVANRLSVQAMNTANAAATNVHATAEAQGEQTLQALASQATQVMLTANAQATARVEGTKQIDLNLFPNAQIKVAVHVPLSGALSEKGTDVRRGTELALAQRSQPLIAMGYNVAIVPYDDQANPDFGVENARQIVVDSAILCVVGHINSSVAIPASEIYHEAGLALVSPMSTNPQLTMPGYPEINRIIGRDDKQGSAAAQYLKSQGVNTVYIAYQNFLSAQGNAEGFKNTAESLGMSILGYENADTAEQMNPIAERAAPLNPDAVYFAGNYDMAAPLFARLRAVGYQGFLAGTDGLDVPDLLSMAGASLKNGKGTIYTTSYDKEFVYFSQAAQTFFQDFQTYFGEPPKDPFFAVQGYDAMSVCLKGIENAIKQKGSVLFRDDVASAIRALRDFPGTYQTINFDSKGDLVNSRYLVYQVTANSPAFWGQNTFLGVVEVSGTP